jgi:phosphomannomutase
MITGLSVHPENPLLMDFIVSTGNSGMTADQVKKESDRLIKYFLACLTIPENNQWVNLSPYEKQRIVPEDLGQTVLGQDMMAQDYLLKQLTASLIYPEKNLGKNFWDTVYAKASQMYGTSQIPVNTFNKVWILPDTAKVFEHNNTVFVVKSHLKVMLDEDYLALKKHADTGAMANPSSVNNLGSKIVRQIILPAIEKEVNTGKNFAQLRQIYNSMILAVWFKKNLKLALLNQVYTDKSKVNGVNADDPAIKGKIYKQYLQAYKKGVFNYIKEEVDQNSQEVIPRKYFSGGLTPETHVDMASVSEAQEAFRQVPSESRNFDLAVLTQGANRADTAMMGQPSQDLENILSEKLSSAKEKIQPLLDTYYAAKAAGQTDEAKELDGTINKIIDQLNAYSQSRPEDLILSDDIESLSNFLGSPAAGEYQAQARADLLSGDYVPQFIFAGAATRLNRGPMYNLDIWDIAFELGKAKPEDAKYHMGMGPRQIVAYRLALEELARQNGASVQDVLARQKMIVNVNADIEQIVLDDFIKNNFYGFRPENVYFITQPTFHGFKFQNGSLEFDAQSPTVPYGHGHNFMQLGEKGQAFILGTDGSRHYLNDSILSQFSDSVLIGSHRINDLTKLSKDSVISVDKLAFAISKIEHGFDVVAELVDNPNKQKGGNALKNTRTRKSFLIEASNVKGNPGLVSLLDEAGKIGAPYNAFRLVYGVGKLKKILAEPLPFNLRFKDGYFYLEAVTGDMTQMPQTNAAFMSSGEQIHDFKEPKNMDDALKYLQQSDNQLDKAMASGAQFRPDIIRAAVSPQNQAVIIKQGTAGWRAFVNGNGNLQNGEGPFNEENIGRIVAALATKINAWVKKGNYKPVREDGRLHALVAYDSRSNGKAFATYAAGVAYAYGMDVDMSNNYVATPEAMARSLRSLKNEAYDVVIVVTASHNDYRYNGLKIGMNGTIMPDKLSGQVDALANDAEFRTRYLRIDRNVRFNQVDLKALASQQYQKAFPGLASAVAGYLSTTGKQLIVDFMHGSGGRYAGYYTQMGAEVRKTEPMRDNTYPKNMFMENGKEVPYRPQPIREMLDQELTEFETNSDVPEGSVYSAIDGDGDRFAAWVKQNGKAREISPNEVMLLTLWHLKESNRLPSDLKYIVVTAPTSYMVRKYAEAIGLKVIEESVGFKFLGPHLNGEDPRQAVLTWEESGHGGFRMVSSSGEVTTFVDDANAQSLYFLDIISSLPQGRDVLSVLDDLRNQIKYDLNYDKIAVNGTDEAKDIIRVPLSAATSQDVTAIRDIAAEISQALGQKTPSDENITMTSSEDKQVSLTYFSTGGITLKLNEGLKLKFDDGSWVMIRMSGTEPLIRIYGEFKGNNPRNELNKLAKEIFHDQAMNVFPDEDLDAPGIDDSAQLNHQAVMPGGIDLNSRTLNMQSSGQRVNITFDPAMIAQFKRGDFSGVQIQILNVVPINLMPLLGLKEDEEPVGE